MEMDINVNREIISRLKFIGRIQIGDKFTKDMYVQSASVLTQILRIFYQDNRYKTLVFVVDTINKSFEILKCYEHSKKTSDKMMFNNLIKDLKASKQGLANLKETYCSDVKYNCDLDVLMQSIDTKLFDIEIFPDIDITSPSLSPSLPPPPFPESIVKSYDEDKDKL